MLNLQFLGFPSVVFACVLEPYDFSKDPVDALHSFSEAKSEFSHPGDRCKLKLFTGSGLIFTGHNEGAQC